MLKHITIVHTFTCLDDNGQPCRAEAVYTDMANTKAKTQRGLAKAVQQARLARGWGRGFDLCDVIRVESCIAA